MTININVTLTFVFIEFQFYVGVITVLLRLFPMPFPSPPYARCGRGRIIAHYGAAGVGADADGQPQSTVECQVFCVFSALCSCVKCAKVVAVVVVSASSELFANSSLVHSHCGAVIHVHISQTGATHLRQ